MFKSQITDLARCLYVFTIALAILPVPAMAGEAQTNQLLQRLRQRDMVIQELINRVETLEKYAGVSPAESGPVDTHETTGKDKSSFRNDNKKQEPGLVVADEDMAERALERSLTRAGAVLLPKGRLEFEPSLVYSRQEDSTPAFVMSPSGVIAAETERSSDTLSASLLFRLGLPGDSQLEIGVPYRWRRIETVTNVNFSPVQAGSQTGSAAGDVRIAFAKTLSRGDTGQASVIGRLGWDTDSGKTVDNGISLGGGYTEYSGALTFIKRQDPVVLVSGVSYQHTIENDSIQPGDRFAASFGGYLALNPQTSMNISLSLAYQQETRLAGAEVAGSERVIGTLLIGGSSIVARGTLLNLAVGVGLTADANDLTISLSLPMRF